MRRLEKEIREETKRLRRKLTVEELETIDKQVEAEAETNEERECMATYLRGRFYPPHPYAFIDMALEAVARCEAGDYDAPVETPFFIKDETMPAHEIVEKLRLEQSLELERMKKDEEGNLKLIGKIDRVEIEPIVNQPKETCVWTGFQCPRCDSQNVDWCTDWMDEETGFGEIELWCDDCGWEGRGTKEPL